MKTVYITDDHLTITILAYPKEDIEIHFLFEGGNNGGRYSSKGSSLERGNYSGRHNYDGRGSSRSGSQHRINDGAGPSGMNISGPNLPMSRSSAPPPSAPVVKPPTPPPTVAAVPASVPKFEDEEQMKRFCKNICDEYINDNCTFEECEADIRASIPPSYFATMVTDS